MNERLWRNIWFIDIPMFVPAFNPSTNVYQECFKYFCNVQNLHQLQYTYIECMSKKYFADPNVFKYILPSFL